MLEQIKYLYDSQLEKKLLFYSGINGYYKFNFIKMCHKTCHFINWFFYYELDNNTLLFKPNFLRDSCRSFIFYLNLITNVIFGYLKSSSAVRWYLALSDGYAT